MNNINNIEKIIDSYLTNGDIESELHTIRRNIKTLQNLEYVAAIINIAKNIKDKATDFLNEYPKSSLEISIGVTKDTEGMYLQSSLESDEYEYDFDKSTDNINSLLFSEISQQDILENDLDEKPFQMSITQSNLSSIEEKMLNCFTEQQYVVIFKAIKMSKNLDNKNIKQNKKNRV